ncbi:MAG TPA: hypothetical protein VLF94_03955 [Chlamydiales bacterium]|nr:hypothetical protein [Chlamydiales bacterium]
MKKLLLAFVALAFAFAISSCCDQSRCPANMRKAQENGQCVKPNQEGAERPYRWDRSQQGTERDRRW